MAITQNTYTGDGSTVLFSFTFPYLETTDIKVSLDGSITNAYSLANATTVQFNSAPANGAVIRIYRDTDDTSLASTFYPGSAIRSQDLNENFTQNLYVTQEISNYSVQDTGNVTLSANYTFINPVSGATPTLNAHFVTKQYVDALAFSATGIGDGSKGDITVSGGGTVWTITAAGLLTTSEIGTTVQAYDADTAKLDVAQTFTAQQTFGELKETVFTLGTTGTVALDPANGSIQSSVLTGDPTFTDSLEAGQTVVLMLENGASYTVTWPTITWVTSGGNVAPTLTAKDTLVFWKVSTTLYGAYVGSYV